MVHPPGLHAMPDPALRGAGSQDPAAPPLRGPGPDPHSTGLGEEPPIDGSKQGLQPVN